MPDRRMRTRMYGGLGGAVRLPYPYFFSRPAHVDSMKVLPPFTARRIPFDWRGPHVPAIDKD